MIDSITRSVATASWTRLGLGLVLGQAAGGRQLHRRLGGRVITTKATAERTANSEQSEQEQNELRHQPPATRTTDVAQWVKWGGKCNQKLVTM